MRTGSTGWWSLDIFRKLMGVDGSAYYETFKHLNAKIIKPAVAEVNKSSDIIIEPEIRKMGRAVSEIRFRIKENPQMAMFQIDDGEGLRNLAVYKALRAQGIADRLARQWITEHGQDYVQEKLDYVAGQGEVKSRAGYLRAAITGDYAGSVAPKPAPLDPATEAKLAEARAARAREQAEEEAAFDARATERRLRAQQIEVVEALVSRRNPTQRDADKRLFLSQLDSDLDREHFRQHGWRSALNASAIIAFWQEREPEAFEG